MSNIRCFLRNVLLISLTSFSITSLVSLPLLAEPSSSLPNRQDIRDFFAKIPLEKFLTISPKKIDSYRAILEKYATHQAQQPTFSFSQKILNLVALPHLSSSTPELPVTTFSLSPVTNTDTGLEFLSIGSFLPEPLNRLQKHPHSTLEKIPLITDRHKLKAIKKEVALYEELKEKNLLSQPLGTVDVTLIPTTGLQRLLQFDPSLLPDKTLEKLQNLPTPIFRKLKTAWINCFRDPETRGRPKPISDLLATKIASTSPNDLKDRTISQIITVHFWMLPPTLRNKLALTPLEQMPRKIQHHFATRISLVDLTFEGKKSLSGLRPDILRIIVKKPLGKMEPAEFEKVNMALRNPEISKALLDVLDAIDQYQENRGGRLASLQKWIKPLLAIG